MGLIARWTTRFVRRHSRFKSVARAMLNRVPDYRVTRSIRGLGPIHFRLRRHHYLWTRPLLGDGMVLGILHSQIRPGDIVYDVGANIGLYSRIFIQWYNADKVVAFEPMTENVELLRENVRLAPDPSKIMFFPTALGDRTGFEELQVDDISSGSAVLSKISDGKAAKFRRLRNLPPLTELIPIWRLDDLVAEEKIPPPNILKIDTEGAGGIVLRGAVKMIDANSPRIVLAVHGEQEYRSSLDVLTPLNYHCYSWIPRNGRKSYCRVGYDDAVHMARGEICCSRVEADVSLPPEKLTQIPII